MRWGRRHEAGEAESAAPSHGGGSWASRLSGIGCLLDRDHPPRSGFALSVTGERIEILALEFGGSQFHVGWSSIAGTIGAIPALPKAGSVPGAWQRALVEIGRTLDADPRAISDPCLIELNGRFLVTALAQSGAARELTTWTVETKETLR